MHYINHFLNAQLVMQRSHHVITCTQHTKTGHPERIPMHYIHLLIPDHWLIACKLLPPAYLHLGKSHFQYPETKRKIATVCTMYNHSPTFSSQLQWCFVYLPHIHIITGCFKIIPAIIFTRTTFMLHVLNWSLQSVYFYQHVQCHNLKTHILQLHYHIVKNFFIRNKEYFEVLVKEELQKGNFKT